MRIIYNLLFYLLVPFLPIRLWLRGRKNPAYRLRWNERFAHYKKCKPIAESIWIHAVSVGESLSAIPLIKALKRTYPKMQIVVTTMTPTGAERMQKTFGDEILQLYVPYDYSGAVKRFLNYINPKILIVMETEFWPNLLHYTKKRKIPIILANARLSTKSFLGYKKIQFLTKAMLASFNLILAQSNYDANLFVQLGAEAKKVKVTGNIKFDLEISDTLKKVSNQLQQLISKDRKVIVAASTHEGEEEQVLQAFAAVLQKHANSLLILVPRHPERFVKVFELCKQSKFNVIRYSEITVNAFLPTDINIIVGDVMGKLLQFYSIADIAFVGGSLVPIGGHNMLEPAVFALPIITGSYLHNFAEISYLMKKQNAMVTVSDANELAEKIILLLQDDSLAKAMGNAAKNVFEANKGATKKILKVVVDLLNKDLM